MQVLGKLYDLLNSLPFLLIRAYSWDPVTGLGTPNFPKMLKLFLDLP